MPTLTPEYGFLLSVATVGLCLGYLAGHQGMLEWLFARVRARKAALDLKLRFLRSPVGASWVLGVEVFLAVIGVFFATRAQWIPAASIISLIVAPSVYLQRHCVQRSQRIHLQVEGFLDALGRAFCAAPSLSEALVSARTALRGPLAEELGEVLEEFHLGVPIEKALWNMAARVPSENLRVAVLTLTLAARGGGRLEQVLLSTANAMREMERLEGVLRAKTAEGKAQTLVISLMPPPVIGVIAWLSPGYFDPLEALFAGHVLVGIALALWCGAAVLSRQILAVDL